MMISSVEIGEALAVPAVAVSSASGSGLATMSSGGAILIVNFPRVRPEARMKYRVRGTVSKKYLNLK
jgi:hypothetical protein